jgi:hypothetical protein
MKKQRLSLQLMKGVEILSPEQLKMLMGGLAEFGSCLTLNQSCNHYVQCCSNNCVAEPSDLVTGKQCKS